MGQSKDRNSFIFTAESSYYKTLKIAITHASAEVKINVSHLASIGSGGPCALELLLFTSFAMAAARADDQFFCAICQDDAGGPRARPDCCEEHIFHEKCLRRWARREKSCPLDKRKFSSVVSLSHSRCGVCNSDVEGHRSATAEPCGHRFHRNCLLPRIRDFPFCPASKCEFLVGKVKFHDGSSEIVRCDDEDLLMATALSLSERPGDIPRVQPSPIRRRSESADLASLILSSENQITSAHLPIGNSFSIRRRPCLSIRRPILRSSDDTQMTLNSSVTGLLGSLLTDTFRYYNRSP